MSSPDRLGVLAHELRSPVAALRALAEAAHGELADGALSQLVVLALASGRDVERLLSDPKLFSLRPEPVSLEELIAPHARPGVTWTAEDATLVGDPTRLRQAVGNLVANGLRHGGAVTVEARAAGDEIVIQVHDDGPGVPEGIDIFAAGVSGSGSTGYGLWLARAIAEAHGGTLTLVPNPGPGATFRLAVPCSAVAYG